MVGSETRNAWAISPVLSPPSSRSVSATCALVDSDGWQQVKISRSRSSLIGPSSGCSRACRSAAWAWRSSRRPSRRRRSIARLRAVVMIHPAGLGGTPPEGQRSSAIAKASWTASSATSMSPKTRTRTATARPYCSRKTRSTSEAESSATPAVSRCSGTDGPRSEASSPGRACRPIRARRRGPSALTIVKPPRCSLPST